MRCPHCGGWCYQEVWWRRGKRLYQCINCSREWELVDGYLIAPEPVVVRIAKNHGGRKPKFDLG